MPSWFTAVSVRILSKGSKVFDPERIRARSSELSAHRHGLLAEKMIYRAPPSRFIGASRARRVILLAAISGVPVCASAQLAPAIKSGAAAYSAMSTPTEASLGVDYRLGIQDSVDVVVFQEEQFSARNAEIDTAGNVTLPLIGKVAAAGKTTAELTAAITQRLSPTYLKHPQVSVTVSNSVSQKVIVQGEVAKPGSYTIRGGSTLLEAISLAGGETRTAALGKVVVFRAIGGKRTGAVFDLKAIRSGAAADPSILPSDMVVVGQSGARRAWEDMLNSMPLVNAFRH
jgi:polysaccharide export outer membrane protein